MRGTPNEVSFVAKAIQGEPDDTIALANTLSVALCGMPPPSGDMGVVVAGVNNSRGVLLGLHSNRQFAVQDFNPAIAEGVDAPIFDYLHNQLRGLLVSPADALDFLCLAGDIYSIVFAGIPRVGSAFRIVGDEDPVPIVQLEMNDAVARNLTRLTAFRMRIMDILL